MNRSKRLLKIIVAVVAVVTSAVVASASAQSAWAANVTLKRVQITDGSRVDLFFDGKVNPQQIRTEFFNDIIQLSLTDVSVYPAKINSVSGSDLTKVFAYQYAPKLTRCRLSVKGQAESYKDRFVVKAEGKVLSLRLVPDKAAQPAPQPQQSAPVATTTNGTNAAAPASPEAAEERALLERVIAGAATKPEQQQKAPAAKTDGSERHGASADIGEIRSQKTASLAGGKPLPSPFRTLLMLGVVLMVFGAIAWGVKRFRGGSGAEISSHKGIGKILAQFGGSKNKMIEVVANHYLGPKKSISVVRIGGRMMVIGVTNESINLITQLPSESDGNASGNLDFESLAMESAGWAEPAVGQRPAQGRAATAPMGSGAMAAGPARPASSQFSQLLGSESAKPSVRAQIRTRMEGMKQL